MYRMVNREKGSYEADVNFEKSQRIRLCGRHFLSSLENVDSLRWEESTSEYTHARYTSEAWLVGIYPDTASRCCRLRGTRGT
jgi:hypothetical protein